MLSVVVTVADGTNVDALAESLFDFLADDPDDLFPEIATVDDFEATVEL
jgi:hypothetical protein